MGDRIMLVPLLIGGIDRFHTHIETEDKVIEVKAETHTIAYSKLSPEF
jgi:hypothetical protein